MKVGILTFPNSVSYGATLQMYSLQQVVDRLGHEVEVINYHSPYMKAEKYTNKARSNPLKFALRRSLRLWMHRRLYGAFRDFEARRIRTYPSRSFTDKRKLVEIGRRYDAVICGSDQVWSPIITNEDLSYFLDFCGEGTKRIAYAPSFGLEQLPEKFSRMIGPQLERFAALSVREQTGKALVESLVDRDVTLVTDPTFLLKPEEWAAMEQPHPAAEGEYVLYFVVSQSDSLLRRCLEFSQAHGLKTVVIGGNPLKSRRNSNPMLEYAVDVGPEKWLYLMHHARYVFTNSFHGTAFSVIFKKDFYVQYPARTGTRLRQVVESLGLEERVVRDGAALTEQPTPYASAQDAFIRMKEASMEFLTQALQ